MSDAGKGSAGSDRAGESVNRSVGLFPDFGTGGLSVNEGVGGVLELLQHDRALGLFDQFLGFGDGALQGENILTSKKSEVITMSLRDGEARIISSAAITDRRSARGSTPLLPMVGDSLQENESSKEYVLYVSVVIEKD